MSYIRANYSARPWSMPTISQKANLYTYVHSTPNGGLGSRSNVILGDKPSLPMVAVCVLRHALCTYQGTYYKPGTVH